MPPSSSPLLTARDKITTVKNTPFRRAVTLATTNAELRKMGSKQLELFADSLKNFTADLLPVVAAFETQCQNMKCKVNLEVSFTQNNVFDTA